jgi:hypothetical protein
MNDDDLRKQLRAFDAPPASEATRGRAKHRALLALGQPGSLTGMETSRHGLLVWGSLVVAALALVLEIFAHQNSTHPLHLSAENLVADRTILQQTEQLFPGQVEAVVQRDGKTDLAIADAPVVGEHQPVLVIFQRGRESIRVLSYSGHRFCLDLGAAHSCFEILESGGGGFILESDNRVWTSAQHPVIDGFEVRAQNLVASR